MGTCGCAACRVLNGSFCVAAVYFRNSMSSSVVQRTERRLQGCQIHLKAIVLPGYAAKQEKMPSEKNTLLCTALSSSIFPCYTAFLVCVFSVPKTVSFIPLLVAS